MSDPFSADFYADFYADKLGLNEPREIISDGVRYRVPIWLIEPFHAELLALIEPPKSLPLVEIRSAEDFAPLLLKLKKRAVLKIHLNALIRRLPLLQKLRKHLPVLLVLTQVFLVCWHGWLLA